MSGWITRNKDAGEPLYDLHKPVGRLKIAFPFVIFFPFAASYRFSPSFTSKEMLQIQNILSYYIMLQQFFINYLDACNYTLYHLFFLRNNIIQYFLRQQYNQLSEVIILSYANVLLFLNFIIILIKTVGTFDRTITVIYTDISFREILFKFFSQCT